MSNRVLIVGVGNILAADDGVGVHAARELLARVSMPPDVDVLEIGTLGPDALALLPPTAGLVFLDAVRGGGAPGSVYRIALEDLDSPPAAPLSAHDLGLPHLLAEARLLGRPLRGVLLGIEPARLDPPGTELSPPVREALPRLLEAALAEARRLLGGA